MAWLPVISTIICYFIVEVVFGPIVAFNLGGMVFAYCLGLFYGTGSTLRRLRDDGTLPPDPTKHTIPP